jgi:hypothetical protein
MRIGDGQNFTASSVHNIWGFKGDTSVGKSFIKLAKPGDRVWFILNKKGGGDGGKIAAVATIKIIQKRELGPLINVSLSNEELGWKNGDWDYELYYNDLYNVNPCNLCTEIIGAAVIRQYRVNNCAVNLHTEYDNIKKYCHITRNMIKM